MFETDPGRDRSAGISTNMKKADDFKYTTINNKKNRCMNVINSC
jgi:hypothetical protein